MTSDFRSRLENSLVDRSLLERLADYKGFGDKSVAITDFLLQHREWIEQNTPSLNFLKRNNEGELFRFLGILDNSLQAIAGSEKSTKALRDRAGILESNPNGNYFTQSIYGLIDAFLELSGTKYMCRLKAYLNLSTLNRWYLMRQQCWQQNKTLRDHFLKSLR